MTTSCSSLNHGIAGEPSSFTIQAFDAFANMRNVGGDEWDIVVVVTSAYGNGTYTATVTPLISGVMIYTSPPMAVHSKVLHSKWT